MPTAVLAGAVETNCAYTDMRERLDCDGVVLVASRQGEDALYQALKARRAEWADRGIASVKLIGDAAAATRPHVSASTARALRAAWGLADALRAAQSAADLGVNLAAWEQEHVAIAQDFTRRGRMIGQRLQVEGSYVPGAPELTQITMPVAP